MGAKQSTQSAFGQSLAKEEKERKASTEVDERDKWQEEMKDFESKKSSSQGLTKMKISTGGKKSMSEDESTRAEQAVNDARKAFLEGNRLFRESRFDVAKSQYSRALSTLQEQLTDVEHHKATALSNIGLIEFAEGRYTEAKQLLSEAAELRKKWQSKSKSQQREEGSPAETSVEGMESLSIELSRDHMMFWRSPTVEQKRLAACLKEHGSVDVVTADSLNNLAACLEVLGRLDEAWPLYEESLNLRKVVYGPHSLKVAESMQNLATILDSQGHLREAEQMLSKSLSIYESLLGKDSPEAAVTMNNLGVLLCHLGRMEKAQDMLEQTVCTRKKVYGEDHHFTVCAKQNLDYVINKKKSMEAFSEVREKEKDKDKSLTTLEIAELGQK